MWHTTPPDRPDIWAQRCIHREYTRMYIFYTLGKHLLTSLCVLCVCVCSSEPCPPNNVQVRMDCRSGSGVVSWESSTGAVGYEAFLDGRNGHSLTCHTSGTFCSVVGLQCGTVYYTRVRAQGETLNSSDSTTVLLVSGLSPSYQLVGLL